MSRVLLFVNGKASQGSEAYAKAAEHLTARGMLVERGEARVPEDYTDVIRRRKGEIDLVVLGGGDGTLRCAVEVLMETGIPLGIIPLGTANNVARSLNIPLDIEGACAVIADGQRAPMDLGKVNDRLFVSVVGMGLSTRVHEEVPDEQKKRWGSLSYAWQAMKMLWQPQHRFRAEIRSDTSSLKVKALQITVCNGRFYGAHVQVHPNATLDDGMLDLSVIESENAIKGFLKALLPIVPAPRSKGLKLLRSRSFTITTAKPLKLDVEGSTDLTTPATFEILPAALTVIVPRTKKNA